MNKITEFAAPLARGFLALIFIMSGISKIGNYAGTQAYMDAMGVPGALLFLVIALEIIGGILIVIGWQARLSAFALAGFSVLSAIIFHADFSDQMQMIMFMKNIAIAGGFMMIVAHGAGAFSMDNRRNLSA